MSQFPKALRNNPKITHKKIPSGPLFNLRSLDTCLALASRGLGCTFSFDICISCFHDFNTPPLYLSTGAEPIRSEFFAATRKGHVLDQAQKDFINILKNQFGD